MNRDFSTYEIVKKLIGEINPIGETTTDNNRYENLQEMLDLVNTLLADIINVSKNRNSQMHSVKKAGQRAHEYMKLVYEDGEHYDSLIERGLL